MALPALDDVRDAVERLDGVARVTPVIGSDLGPSMLLKCENLQRSRAFKFRGIFTRVSRMSAAERARGVVIVSSGNAGLAAAIAARILGIACTVVATPTAIPAKIDAIRRAGGTVVVATGGMSDVFAQAGSIAAAAGSTVLHAFDDADVIAGQGTIALEVLGAVPDLECLVVPTSGGSMLAGSVVTLRALRPEVRIIGVEARGADVLAASLEAGQVIPRDTAATIADGLAYPGYGALNFELVRDGGVEVEVVDDDAILAAMAAIWRDYGQAVEPSAAVAFAGALAAGAADAPTTVAVMSGGNVDAGLLAYAVAGGTAEGWRSR